MDNKSALNDKRTANKYIKEGNYNDALSILLKLKKSFPEDMEVINNLGSLFKVMGKIDQSIDFFGLALSISPEHKAPRRNLELLLHNPAISDQQRQRIEIILSTISQNNAEPIDFVIPWVDGEDPDHVLNRKKYEEIHAKEYGPLESRATGSVRFKQNYELKYCLRSIKKYAPWYRKIWIVTDNQVPVFLDKSKLHADNIEIVDHSTLFRDHHQYLPTFNSRSILSMLWNIPELSEKYILMNDDYFFCNHINPEFFHTNDTIVLRGVWNKLGVAKANLSLFRYCIINGAELFGFEKKYFCTNHTPSPMRISWFKDIYANNKQMFLKNLQYKFRSRDQFQAESAINHYAIKNNSAQLKNPEDHILLSVDFCQKSSTLKAEVFLYMYLIMRKKVSTFCINDYGSMEKTLPILSDCMEEICGPKLDCEI